MGWCLCPGRANVADPERWTHEAAACFREPCRRSCDCVRADRCAKWLARWRTHRAAKFRAGCVDRSHVGSPSANVAIDAVTSRNSLFAHAYRHANSRRRKGESRLESISRSTDAVVFRQKLLAALLNMCNAAENFLRNVVGSRNFAQKKGFESLDVSSDTRFADGLVPTVESPAATGRALCLLL